MLTLSGYFVSQSDTDTAYRHTKQSPLSTSVQSAQNGLYFWNPLIKNYIVRPENITHTLTSSRDWVESNSLPRHAKTDSAHYLGVKQPPGI